MTPQQAIADLQAAMTAAKNLLPLIAPVAPAEVAVAVTAVDVISSVTDVATKLASDAGADTTEEDANLAAANSAMISAAGQLDSNADS
jgi:hypothetical protein